MKRLFANAQTVAGAVSRALDLDGGESVSFLEPLLRASINSLDLTDQQYLRLADVFTFGVASSVPAAAGTASIATLQNPANSQRIYRIRRIIIGNLAAATSHFWGVIASSAVPAVLNTIQPTPAIRDSRCLNPATGVAGRASALLVYGTSLGAPAIGEGATVPAGSVYTVDPLCTIHPGGWFYVASAALNTAFNCAMVWDERIATKSEVNFPIAV